MSADDTSPPPQIIVEDPGGHVAPARGIVILCGRLGIDLATLTAMIGFESAAPTLPPVSQPMGLIGVALDHHADRLMRMVPLAIEHVRRSLEFKEERPMVDKTPKLDQLRALREQQMQRQNERNRASAQNAKSRMKRPNKSTAARKR